MDIMVKGNEFLSGKEPTTSISLSKYLAQAGVASRRGAVELIKQGLVTVNHAVITNPGYKLDSKSTVRYKKQVVLPPRKKFYVLLNKPAGYVTTVRDQAGRPTVFDVLGSIPAPRVHPVGRLDRDTTGLLLFTNDGELTDYLCHPRNRIKKTYHVTLNKPVSMSDRQRIRAGLVLEDGPVTVESLLPERRGKENQCVMTLTSGRNRIVRRIFEYLGYSVQALDRVVYAGLSKRGLSVGSWRFLSEQERQRLPYFRDKCSAK